MKTPNPPPFPPSVCALVHIQHTSTPLRGPGDSTCPPMHHIYKPPPSFPPPPCRQRSCCSHLPCCVPCTSIFYSSSVFFFPSPQQGQGNKQHELPGWDTLFPPFLSLSHGVQVGMYRGPLPSLNWSHGGGWMLLFFFFLFLLPHKAGLGVQGFPGEETSLTFFSFFFRFSFSSLHCFNGLTSLPSLSHSSTKFRVVRQFGNVSEARSFFFPFFFFPPCLAGAQGEVYFKSSTEKRRGPFRFSIL